MDMAHGDAGGLVWSGSCKWENEMHFSLLPAAHSCLDFRSPTLDIHLCLGSPEMRRDITIMRTARLALPSGSAQLSSARNGDTVVTAVVKYRESYHECYALRYRFRPGESVPCYSRTRKTCPENSRGRGLCKCCLWVCWSPW